MCWLAADRMRWWCQRTTPWSRNYPTSSESGPSSGRGSMQLSLLFPPTLPVIIVTSSVCICTLTLCSFLMQETYGARAITYTQSYTPNITTLCNRKQNKLSPVDWLSLYTHTHTHTHTHGCARFCGEGVKDFSCSVPNSFFLTHHLSLSLSLVPFSQEGKRQQFQELTQLMRDLLDRRRQILSKTLPRVSTTAPPPPPQSHNVLLCVFLSVHVDWNLYLLGILYVVHVITIPYYHLV